MDLCSFFDLELHKMVFEDSQVRETDFTNTKLVDAKIRYCDLEKSLFSNTDFTRADLTGSYNFIINPKNNILKKTKFSQEYCIGLLQDLDIIIQ